jgi:hypothetical protein
MLLLYCNQICSEAGVRLQRILESEIPYEAPETYQHIDEFSKRLSRTSRGQGIAILFIATMAEFYEIFSIRSLLKDIRVILILPDRSSDFIRAGYKLRPRFISFMDSDFKIVAVVLRRMLKHTEEVMGAMEQPYKGLHQI